LCWYDDQGNWIPTDTEQERQEKEQERQRAEQAESQLQQVVSQLEQIVLNLLQQGMTVEQVVKITGLSEEQVQRLRAQSGQ
jgi:DNA-directed RNA polymerase specialized sigma subunit